MTNKQDMLAWLSARREALNARIVAASPQEEGQYLGELQIINAIEARLNEMTAVEFLRTVDEECAKYEGVNYPGSSPCRLCPFEGRCIYGDDVEPSVAVDIVKKWKEEHP